MINEKDQGVSPVIGVILLVAITVILAALIGAFVFGLFGGFQPTKNLAVTASRTPTGAQATIVGGIDVKEVTAIALSLYDGGTLRKNCTFTSYAVGHVEPCDTGDTFDRAVVTASWGSYEQVILDANL